MNKSSYTSHFQNLAKQEISRLNKLLVDSQIKILILKRKGKEEEEFYTSLIKYLTIKITAWEQFINYEKDENILDQINEAMDAWLQKGWLYFGQEHLKEESENAMEEYRMFQHILTSIPNKPKKPKKPRRRGGKKHKKKEKNVWDEIM
tara:strand:+ start:705 stop:1148 length:444 start_codon:yes stop_codon:yes gene_type:complete